MDNERPARTTGFYVGLGCGVIALVLFLVVGGLLIWGARTLGTQIADLKDPVRRDAKVRSILGAEKLPAGYHPSFALSLERPISLSMAILSTRVSEDASPSIDPSALSFTYYEMESERQKIEELRDFIEGSRDDTDQKERFRLEASVMQHIGRGNLVVGLQHVSYTSFLGAVKIAGPQPEATGERAVDSLNTLAMVECPGVPRLRVAVWSGPRPAVAATGIDVGEAGVAAPTAGEAGAAAPTAGEAGAAAPTAGAEGLAPEWVGTRADPSQIEEFFSHFDFCRTMPTSP